MESIIRIWEINQIKYVLIWVISGSLLFFDVTCTIVDNH